MAIFCITAGIVYYSSSTSYGGFLDAIGYYGSYHESGCYDNVDLKSLRECLTELSDDATSIMDYVGNYVTAIFWESFAFIVIALILIACKFIYLPTIRTRSSLNSDRANKGSRSSNK